LVIDASVHVLVPAPLQAFYSLAAREDSATTALSSDLNEAETSGASDAAAMDATGPKWLSRRAMQLTGKEVRRGWMQAT
jgi:hypothetical protein